MYNNYFTLLNFDKVYPNFWTFVHPKYLHNDNMSFESLRKLDEDIDFLDVDRESVHLLPKDSKAVYWSLQPIYKKGHQVYMQNLRERQQ